MNAPKVASPYGAQLVDLLVSDDRAEELKNETANDPSVTLSHRQVCDLELLLNGAMSPLTGFMNRECYESVLGRMQLPDGQLWPMPITLDVPDNVAEGIEVGQRLALRDAEGFMPAFLTVEDIWEPDKKAEAEQVYGTQSTLHPGVRYLTDEVHKTYVGGTVTGIQSPAHYDFENLWDSPSELRHLFEKMGWRNVVAFHTTKPMHRLHRELTLQAAKDTEAHILLHPAVGMTKPGDLSYYSRVHCYQAIRRYFPHNLAVLSLLPLAMRMAGPREALWHAIIHQNYGCTHVMIGPDYASPPGQVSTDNKYHATYAAQELFAEHQNELGTKMVAVEEHCYVAAQGCFLPRSVIDKQKLEGTYLSDDEIKQRLLHQSEIPGWFSYPEVVQEMRKACPPRSKEGFTLFFTGLSGSGKSTLAKIVYAKLIEFGGRPVTLLDGDVVRLNLSSELGFSKEHRNLNVRRIGFVANEITKNGGVAICAPIAPYTAMRRSVRGVIEESGAFLEIHVATPLEVCEARDRKGLYAKARKGIIPEFTGISDPYEEPERPEIRIDTSTLTPMEAAQQIFLFLFKEGYIDSSQET